MKAWPFALAGAALALWGCAKGSEAGRPATFPPLSVEQRALVLQRGKAITGEASGLLSSNLQSAIKTSGVSNALPFCSMAASPLTAGLATKHGVNIRRVTHKSRNPADQADPIELTILKEFETALADGNATNPPPPLVTNWTATTATFFAPIVLNNELCLQCHGEPGRDIAPENLATIRRLYPVDEALGFKLGDLRGAWRIDMSLGSLNTKPSAPSP